MRIVLGVAGGIAAYKAVLLLRLLREAGHEVRVVPTRCGARVRRTSHLGSAVGSTRDHRRLRGRRRGRPRRDRAAGGAGRRRTRDGRPARRARQPGVPTTCSPRRSCVTRAPVLLAPAMHTEMWQHPATVANVATLRSRGVHVLEPASGRLTGTDTGPGRLPEPEEIAAAALALVAHAPGTRPAGQADVAEGDLARARDLAGWRVVVSAGGTREPIDPVRFLGNRSSGRQGVALAAAAARRGARVTLVAANLAVPAPDRSGRRDRHDRGGAARRRRARPRRTPRSS